jgi:hypothetical protein
MIYSFSLNEESINPSSVEKMMNLIIQMRLVMMKIWIIKLYICADHLLLETV